ncbi:MAG TPA: pectinesterase family protein, partial [Bryobacteraceae bacterium]|nr:pectinesterase family protein [Bryobacteraceae bacterium]
MRTLILLLASTSLALADSTVALDGSAQFKSIQQAIDAAPSGSTTRFVIHIKPGVYKEHILIPPSKPFLSLLGEDPDRTILTFDLYANVLGPDGKPIGTFRTPSVTIQASDFIAEN